MFSLIKYTNALLRREAYLITLRSQLEIQKKMVRQMERTVYLLEQNNVEIERELLCTARKDASGN